LYGVGKSQVLLAHPKSLRIRQLVAPFFLASILFGLILSWSFAPVDVVSLGILVTYVLFNLGFSVFVALRDRPHVFWLAPFAYLTIHLCWGAGFWVGLFMYPRFLARSHQRNTAYMPLPQSARSA
jgi:hypothetical protein